MLIFIFIVFVLLFRCYPIILIGPKLRPKAHFCLPKSVPKAGQQWTQQDPISRGPNGLSSSRKPSRLGSSPAAISFANSRATGPNLHGSLLNRLPVHNSPMQLLLPALQERPRATHVSHLQTASRQHRYASLPATHAAAKHHLTCTSPMPHTIRPLPAPDRWASSLHVG